MLSRFNSNMAGGSLADDGGSQELAAWVEHVLLDDLVSPDEDGLRDCEAERLGSLEVNHELELGWLLHWEIRRLRAFQDLVYVAGGAPEALVNIDSICHETTGVRELLQPVDRRDAAVGCQLRDPCSL